MRNARCAWLALSLVAEARAESHRLGHDYLGCEHVGIALLKHPNQRTALQRLGVDAEQERGGVRPPAVALPLTSRTTKVFEYAADSARALGHQFTGAENMLVGLVRERLNIAAQVLLASGLQVEKVLEQAGRA